jgi:hypothetical protein
MNRLVNLSSINIILICLFSAFIFSCHNKNEQSQKVAANRERFFEKLPIQKPDSAIQLIKDSITNVNELKSTDTRLLKAVYFKWDIQIVPAYLNYLKPKFSVEGGDAQGFYEILKGKYYYGLGKIDSSLILLKSGSELLKKGTDSSYISIGFMELGRFYVMQQYNLLGTEAALTGLKYLPQKNKIDVDLEMLLKQVLLASYSMAKKHKQAKYLALELLHKNNLEKQTKYNSVLYGTLSAAFFCLGQKDSALWAAQKYDEGYHIYNDDQGLFGSLNLGLSWKSAGQWEKALIYLRISKQKSDSLGIQAVSLMATVGLGHTYLALNEFNKAEKCYSELLVNENFRKNTSLFRNISDSMVVLKLKKSKDYENIAHFYTARQLTDTLTTREDNLIWSEMNVRYESAEKEKKIQALASEKSVYKFQFLSMLLILVIILGIGAWYFYQNRQKQLQLAKENALLEKNKQLLAKENALLEENQQLLVLKNQLQEKEIRTNKEQLETFRENLSTKMQLVEEMEKQMNLLVENASCIANEEILQSKAKLNEMKILTDKDWRMYLNYIEKVHPNLIQNIKQKYIDLTEGELRLFVLIYLGFSTAEISNILGISVSGVHKNRYRLRTKLALTEEMSLNDFVKNSF